MGCLGTARTQVHATSLLHDALHVLSADHVDDSLDDADSPDSQLHSGRLASLAGRSFLCLATQTIPGRLVRLQTVKGAVVEGPNNPSAVAGALSLSRTRPAG